MFFALAIYDSYIRTTIQALELVNKDPSVAGALFLAPLMFTFWFVILLILGAAFLVLLFFEKWTGVIGLLLVEIVVMGKDYFLSPSDIPKSPILFATYIILLLISFFFSYKLITSKE